MKTGLAASPSTYMVANYVRLFTANHRIKELELRRPEQEWLFSADQLSDLQALALSRIREGVANDSLRGAPRLGMLLYVLAEWGSEAEARDYAEKLRQDDRGFVDLVSGFVSRGWSDAQREWFFRTDSLPEFVGVDESEFASRCEDIVNATPCWLTETQRRALSVVVQSVRARHHEDAEAQPGGGVQAPSAGQGPSEGTHSPPALDSLSTPDDLEDGDREESDDI